MAACDTGKMILYVRSILWDLDVPQEAATIAYEDNDGCTSMGNAQKPTARTRHIDIKYFALCDWIERDLLLLERVLAQAVRQNLLLTYNHYKQEGCD